MKKHPKIHASRRLTQCLAAVVWLLLSAIVPAQAVASPSAERIRAAQNHFDEAVAAYQADDLARALTLFQQAYEDIPDPVFLYNAARVAEKLEELELALDLAERAGIPGERALPEELALKNAELQASLSAELAQKNAGVARLLGRQVAQAVIVRQKTLWRAQQNAIAARAAAPPPSDSDGWGWAGISGAAAGIGGLGLIAGATYLGMRASEDIRGLHALNDPAAYTRSRRDIEASQSTGQLLLYSGVGLAAVGSGLLVWEMLRAPEHSMSVSISAGPQLVGIGVSGGY